MTEHVNDEQLSLLVDARLSLAAREAVVAHVRSCPSCAERHDRVIDATAALRLAGAVRWSPPHTAAAVARLQPQRRRDRWRRRIGARDWALPLASAIGLAGCIALVAAPLGVAAAIVAAPANAGALLSLALPVPGPAVAALVAAALGLLAYPLSRSR